MPILFYFTSLQQQKFPDSGLFESLRNNKIFFKLLGHRLIGICWRKPQKVKDIEVPQNVQTVKH